MNKDLIIGILIILLLASAGTTVYFSQKGPVVVGGETTKELCGILPLYTGTLGGGSSQTPQTIARDICYMVFAHEKSDPAICKKVSMGELQGDCYAALAVKTGKAELCDSASADTRDRCYTEAAGNMRNVASCAQINTPDARDNCIMNYVGRAGDPDGCRKIASVRTKNSCFMNQAFRNPNLCKEISDVAMRQECTRNTNHY